MANDLKFSQSGPHLGNQFTEDSALQEYLSSFADCSEFYRDLENFGSRVVSDILEHHNLCERFPPVFEEFDAWGSKIDKITTHSSWNFMHKVSAEEQLIHLGYTCKKNRRLHQFAKLYLFSSSSGLYICPLAMTEGAAFLLRSLLQKSEDSELQEAFSRVTSSDPNQFWTSGQWMTEKRGGSDVSGGSQTIAEHLSGDTYKLYGYKWFTSATTANMAFTLARVDGKLSLFFVKVKDEEGRLNNIRIVRLKEKLGTKQLPTAEMVLEGTVAKLVSPVGKGVSLIANLVNMTRLYNSIGAVSAMRRITALARDYSHRRFAFNKYVKDHPLHQASLSELEVITRGCLIFVLYTAHLLEKSEDSQAKDWEVKTLRVLTPVIKLYTAKMAIKVVSEGIECIGGVAYMENSGIPGILRDAQVYSIWEGTTNVLSLDVQRALIKNSDPSASYLKSALESLGCDFLSSNLEKILESFKNPYAGRKCAWALGSLFIEALLRWHSHKTGTQQDSEIANYWARLNPSDLVCENPLLYYNLALDVGKKGPRGFGDYDSLKIPRPKF